MHGLDTIKRLNAEAALGERHDTPLAAFRLPDSAVRLSLWVGTRAGETIVTVADGDGSIGFTVNGAARKKLADMFGGLSHGWEADAKDAMERRARLNGRH